MEMPKEEGRGGVYLCVGRGRGLGIYTPIKHLTNIIETIRAENRFAMY